MLKSGAKYMGPALGAALVYLFTTDGRVMDSRLFLVFFLAVGGIVWFAHDEAKADREEHDSIKGSVQQGPDCRYGGPATSACFNIGACGCHVIPLPDNGDSDG